MSATFEIVDDYDSNRLSDAAEEMLDTLPPELRQIARCIRVKAMDANKMAQSAIERVLEVGELLLQLQEGLGHSHGGDRKGGNFKVPRGTLILFTFEDLASELGVPRRTAFRWMSLAKADQLAQRIEAGEVIELPPTSGDAEPRKVGGTIEHSEIARKWRESLIAGETPITRAQPALMGALATKKTGRAPCNHAENIARAIKALANSLEYWNRLEPEERARCESLWKHLAASPLIPSTWGVR